MLQHRTQCIAPLLVLLCSGLLVSWSGLPPALLELPRPWYCTQAETYHHHHHWSWSSSPLFIRLYRSLTKLPGVKEKTIRVSEALQKPPGKNLENANNRLENLPTSDIPCFLLLLICSSSDNVQTDRRTRTECGKSGRQHIRLFDEIKTKTSFSKISVAESKNLSLVADIKGACYTEKDML